jgi:CHAD domain-containing protein
MAKPRKIRWNERAGPAVNAKRRLPTRVSEYFKCVRELMAGDPAAEELHRVRLETKRLRYSLELFRACYGPGLETRIAELRRVQQVLGDLNDCATAVRHLAGRVQPRYESKTSQFLEERIQEKAQEFRKYWVEAFDAPGRELWWTGYLSRGARAPVRRA